MPAPLIEEGEKALKDLVRDVNVLVLLLKGVQFKHTAVQIGDAPELLEKTLRAPGRVESILEQLAQEPLVERAVELVLAAFHLHLDKLVLEIHWIKVEELLLLDEVAEHQPIQHHRGIPLPLLLVVNALNALDKLVMLLAEALVELLRHIVLVDQERRIDLVDHFNDRRFFLQCKRDIAKLLPKKARLIVLSVLNRDELTLVNGLHGDRPEVVEVGCADIHGQILVAGLAKPGVDHAPHRRIRHLFDLADVNAEPLLLRGLRERIGRLSDADPIGRRCRRIVPTRVNEELAEICRVEILEKFILAHDLLFLAHAHRADDAGRVLVVVIVFRHDAQIVVLLKLQHRLNDVIGRQVLLKHLAKRILGRLLHRIGIDLIRSGFEVLLQKRHRVFLQTVLQVREYPILCGRLRAQHAHRHGLHILNRRE